MTTEVEAPAAPAAPVIEGQATEVAPVAAAPVEGAPPADVIAERPADLPESLWDDAAKAPKYGDIAALAARAADLEAAETARKDGVPADPKDYKFEPAGEAIVGLDGQPAAIDPANPLVTAVAAAAHKHGAPQALVSDLVRAFIETEVASEKGVKEALDAEVAKLGDKARDRVTAVQGFIKEHCGASADDAIATLGTAGAVQAWEAVMQKITGASMSAVQNQDAKPKGLVETWFPSMNKNAA